MSDRLDERALEQLCLGLVEQCGVELPLDPWELCRRLEQVRARRITITGAALGGPHSVGHLLVAADRDRIFFDEAASSGLRAQVICHEVIHLVRGHLDGEAELTCGALLIDPAQGRETARDPSSRYAAWQEWEAEVGATYLTGLARRRATPSTTEVIDDELGLASAFGLGTRSRSGGRS